MKTSEIDVQDQEFVVLDADGVRALLANDQRSSADRRDGPRRRVQRWPFPGTVQIQITDSMGEEVELLGTCHNINEHGIGFQCERSIPVGMPLPIAIHQPDATYHGRCVVRHCTASDGEYFIGVEFVTGDLE